VVQILEVIEYYRLAFEFQNSILFVSHVFNQNSGQASEAVKGHAVGEFSGAYPEKALRFFMECRVKFGKKIVHIDKEGEPGVVEVCL